MSVLCNSEQALQSRRRSAQWRGRKGSSVSGTALAASVFVSWRRQSPVASAIPLTYFSNDANFVGLGFIASPHTSAGRIPTPRGYRLFVDTMLTADRGPLNAPSLAPDQPQKVIANAANLLSDLSHFVGVVIAPRRTSVFRHIEFLRLSERRFLVIIVSPEGDVQNRVLFTETDYTQSQLIEASNYLNHHFAGMAIEQVREKLLAEVESLRSEIAVLMQTAVQVSSEALTQAQDYCIGLKHVIDSIRIEQQLSA